MKDYPVNSVCILTGACRDEYRGMECTIVEPQIMRDDRHAKGLRYVVSVNGLQGTWYASHNILTLRRFPPDTDAWLRVKMKDVLKPVDIKESV
jgi:hypothetical protein